MKIFISYRRDDSAGYAGRLFDYLSARFGADHVFMDIDTIEPGEDFRKVVSRAVGTCDVVLVMIGKQWLNIVNAQGQRRLDDPRDWVRMEIGAALDNRRVRVIPVLVRDAAMPGEHELPEGLKELAYRNAIELSDSRFQHDVRKLIEVLERIAPKTPTAPPAPAPKPAPVSGTNKTRKTLLYVGMSFVVLMVLAGLLFLRLLNFGPGEAPSTQSPAASPTPVSLPSSTPELVLQPTWTSTVPPTDTFTPEPSPTSTPQSLQDHLVQLIDEYYMCINNARHDQRQDYAPCWDMLSDRPGEFQDFLNQNSGGEDAFITSWNKYKVSYALYYCFVGGQDVVYADYYYHEWDNLSQIHGDRNILEYRFAFDGSGWRITGAYPRSEIHSNCESQPRVDRRSLFP